MACPIWPDSKEEMKWTKKKNILLIGLLLVLCTSHLISGQVRARRRPEWMRHPRYNGIWANAGIVHRTGRRWAMFRAPISTNDVDPALTKWLEAWFPVKDQMDDIDEISFWFDSKTGFTDKLAKLFKFTKEEIDAMLKKANESK